MEEEEEAVHLSPHSSPFSFFSFSTERDSCRQVCEQTGNFYFFVVGVDLDDAILEVAVQRLPTAEHDTP